MNKSIKVVILLVVTFFCSIFLASCGNEVEQNELSSTQNEQRPNNKTFIQLDIDYDLFSPFYPTSKAFKNDTEFIVTVSRFTSVNNVLVGAGFEIEWKMSDSNIIEMLPQEEMDEIEKQFCIFYEFKVISAGKMTLTAVSKSDDSITSSLEIEVLAPSAQRITTSNPRFVTYQNGFDVCVDATLTDVYIVNGEEFTFIDANTPLAYTIFHENTSLNKYYDGDYGDSAWFVGYQTYNGNTISGVGRVSITFFVKDQLNVSATISFTLTSSGSITNIVRT